MFCYTLTNCRLSLGLTQRQMAARLGISPSALGMYEQGRRVPGPRTATRLAAFLGEAGFTLPPVPKAPESPSPQLLSRGCGKKQR